jgi:hypothetical protein
MIDAGAIRAARAELSNLVERHGEEAALEAIRRLLSAKRRSHAQGTPERAEVVALSARAASRLGHLRRDVGEASDDAAPW